MFENSVRSGPLVANQDRLHRDFPSIVSDRRILANRHIRIALVTTITLVARRQAGRQSGRQSGSRALAVARGGQGASETYPLSSRVYPRVL